MAASEHGHLEMLKWLLKNGCPFHEMVLYTYHQEVRAWVASHMTRWLK